MIDVCVLFFHHQRDPVTVANLASIRASNPGVPVVPVYCRDGGPCDPVPDAVEVPRTSSRGNWHDADLVWAAWFRSPQRVEAERYVWFESDTFCTTGVREWYAEVWHEHVVCAAAVLRGRDRWGPFGRLDCLPEEWRPHAAGLTPLCGVMLSREALAEFAAMSDPLEGAYCELRLATAMHWFGFDLTSLPDDKAEVMGFVGKPYSRPIEGAGVFHPVRR